MRYAWYESPIGSILIAKDEAGVRRIAIPDRDPVRPDAPRRPGARAALAPESDWVRDEAGLEPERAELAAYFAGELREFEMAVEPEGTPFQREVWAELARIAYGETVSYQELARRVGVARGGDRATSARAVGGANGANPIAIVLPCHRVIAADGTLGGYGGGLDRKTKLLAHERGKAVFSTTRTRAA